MVVFSICLLSKYVRPACTSSGYDRISDTTMFGKVILFVAFSYYWFVINVCTIFVQLNLTSVNSVYDYLILIEHDKHNLKVIKVRKI